MTHTYCTYDYSCPDYAPALVNGTCVWPCEENYYWENGECRLNCSSKWYKVINGKWVCQEVPCQNFIKKTV